MHVIVMITVAVLEIPQNIVVGRPGYKLYIGQALNCSLADSVLGPLAVLVKITIKAHKKSAKQTVKYIYLLGHHLCL